MSIELILLGASILFFMSILACKAGYRFGVPILLLFLFVGMLCGSDGLGLIRLGDSPTSYGLAQTIGTIALCVILFSGGMDTKIEDIKPVIGSGIMLATVGVILTAFITGLLILLTFSVIDISGVHLSFMMALLIGSMMSSTDSASVFSILRSKGLHLRGRLRPLLELESGSNDPMAFMMTTMLIGLLSQGSSPSYGVAIIGLFKQFLVGGIVGVLFGKFFVWLINNIKIDNASLYPIMVLTCCIFMFSASYFLGGNSYLAVYLGGLIVGNSKFVHRRSSMNFFDGLAWLSQIVMFLTLGLLVNPHDLIPVIWPGVVISILMIGLARPISVFVSLMPFKGYDRRDKMFVSWVGLRGAVPIIFAILALSNGVPQARLLFNTVFVCTLVSLIVQGTSLSFMAEKLKLSEDPTELGKVKDFDMEIADELKTILAELTISERVLTFGDRLLNLPLPENTLAVLVKRDDNYFVPNGKTELFLNDKVLLLSDDRESLMGALSQMGVKPEVNEDKMGFKGILGDLQDLAGDIKSGKFLKI